MVRRNDLGGDEITRRSAIARGGAVMGTLAIGGLIQACGSGGGSSSSSGSTSGGGGASASGVPSTNKYAGMTPQPGGTLRYAMPSGSPSDTMDPALGNVPATTFYYSYALYDRLWRTNPATYAIEPALVDTFEHNADGTVWTVKLKDVKFHDGSPLRAKDVLASVARMLDPRLASQRAGMVRSVNLGKSQAVDDKTVRFVLDRGNVTFPEAMAQFVQILPENFDPKHPIGTGPFKFVSFTPGREARFARFADYYLGAPHLDELVITSYASPTAAANAIQSGEVDMANAAYELTDVLKNASGVNLQSFLVYGYAPFRMRTDVAPFDDVRVRQAFRLIAGRQEIVDQAYLGQGAVANDLYAKQDPDYDKTIPQREQDLAKARALLAAAGKSGMTIQLNTTDIVPGINAAATVFARQAKGAGVNVQVNKLDIPTFFGPNYPQYAFCVDYRSTASFLLSAALNDGPTSTGNLTRFRNAEFSKLYFEALGEFDDAKRQDKIHRMQRIQWDEGSYIIWGFNYQLKAYRRVGGIVPDVGALPPHWAELWLAKS